MSEAGQTTHPLLVLIELGQAARRATTLPELGFLLVNDTRRLLPYRQALLWFEGRGLQTVSGLLAAEANTPFSLWLNRLMTQLNAREASAGTVQRIRPEELPAELAAEWGDWLSEQVYWVGLPANNQRLESCAGGVLFVCDEVLDEATHPLLAEWVAVWLHAWNGVLRPLPYSPTLLLKRLRAWFAQGDGLAWWRRPRLQLALLLLALMLCPVRLSVLAPGELVPLDPAVIRAPLDGVLAQVHVRANQAVKAGDPLFSFDEASIAARLEVARQTLATAETEYRQLAQMAVSDVRSKAQLSGVLGKMAEKQAEVDFLAGQFARAKVLAPQDGVALLDDPTELIGKPLQTGERIMRIANPAAKEIEAWIPIGDAIPLPEQADVQLFLSATPLSSEHGQLRYLAHDALPRPDGSYAYRLRASLDGSSDQRIGMKGTVKVQGGWVPAIYWVMRRPLASIRQFLVL
jgi:Biotin-lipoyl like/HlyD family secretion protein